MGTLSKYYFNSKKIFTLIVPGMIMLEKAKSDDALNQNDRNRYPSKELQKNTGGEKAVKSEVDLFRQKVIDHKIEWDSVNDHLTFYSGNKTHTSLLGSFNMNPVAMLPSISEPEDELELEDIEGDVLENNKVKDEEVDPFEDSLLKGDVLKDEFLKRKSFDGVRKNQH